MNHVSTPQWLCVKIRNEHQRKSTNISHSLNKHSLPRTTVCLPPSKYQGCSCEQVPALGSLWFKEERQTVKRKQMNKIIPDRVQILWKKWSGNVIRSKETATYNKEPGEEDPQEEETASAKALRQERACRLKFSCTAGPHWVGEQWMGGRPGEEEAGLW